MSTSSSSSATWHQSHPTRGRHRSQKKPDNADLPFIHFTAQTVSRSKDADKLIRAQAAKASANRRLETMEKRRKLKKRAGSTDPTPPVSPTFVEEGLGMGMGMISRTKSAPPMLRGEHELTAMGSSLSPPTPTMTMTMTMGGGWKCGLAGLVEDTFIAAIAALNASQLRCDTDVIWEALENPSLYDDSLMVQCLELLVTTGPSLGRLALSRSTIDLARHQLLVAVQAAVQQQNGESLALAPVVALLAGWEATFGDPEACKFHLTALSGITPVHSPRRKRAVGSIAAACIPMPAERLAPGFKFYMSLDLLPSCLLRQIEQLNHTSASEDEDFISARRATSAALACTSSPSSSLDALSPASTEPSTLADAIATHVQLATALLTLLIRTERPGAEDLKDCLSAWHTESLLLTTEPLFGTIYDEILLWCLCVFNAASPSSSPESLDLLVSAMDNQNIQSWQALEALLKRYICPFALLLRMRSLLGHVFFQHQES